jgi:hypothetical protein
MRVSVRNSGPYNGIRLFPFALADLIRLHRTRVISVRNSGPYSDLRLFRFVAEDTTPHFGYLGPQ